MKLRKKIVKAGEVELEEKVVAVNRVTKVVKGGRNFTFSTIVVVGNGEGVVGFGLGKAREVQTAIQKGVDDAKKNLIKVPVLRETIPHQVDGKFDGGHIMLKPASPGTGVIAGGAVRAVLESAGIHNVLAKSKGSSNPHNVVRATFNGLMKLRDPLTIAAQRNIPLEKVFDN
ncbi:MAG: 30S ribosomal protein S5 [Bacteroidetes bacterium]|nr:30S ribosomal protein S5 [Bacteroidota bacterium]